MRNIKRNEIINDVGIRFCPFCRAMGETSMVSTRQTSPVTLMCDDEYFDEQGNYHYHNPNVRGVIKGCNKGHTWIVSYSNKCGFCDFGEPSTWHETDNTEQGTEEFTNE